MIESKIEKETAPQVVLGHHMTILIAEDDRGHYLLTKNYLHEVGIRNKILWFEDGQAILDFLNSEHFQREGQRYILLLDIRMPKADGMEVLEKIKQNSAFDNIFVIMLTTSEDQEQARRCYTLGCDAHIIKPPGPVLLRAMQRACR